MPLRILRCAVERQTAACLARLRRIPRRPGLRGPVARPALLALPLLIAAGCTSQLPPYEPIGQQAAVPATPEAARATALFQQVTARVEPVAEAFCRAERPDLNCDFRIIIDDSPLQQPNAFHRIDQATGQPLVGFNIALINAARSPDELAFVMGHEAAHHVAGHISRTRSSANAGALVLGTLAAISGAGPVALDTAARIGANIGARSYSQDFELEADTLGVIITARAGYDPVRGAGFFGRLPDPGDTFLGSHPPNQARMDQVERTAAALRDGRLR